MPKYVVTDIDKLLYKALLEAYKNLDNWEEILLEPQEIIVLERPR